MKWTLEEKGNVLVTPTGNRVCLAKPAEELLPINEVVIILLRAAGLSDREARQNVFGADVNGRIIWQIEARRLAGDDGAYTGLGREADLGVLYNWNGFAVYVDPITGHVVKEEITR